MLVLEDLQWIDQASEAFLASLVERLAGTRLYSKPDILKMIGVAGDGLASYEPIFTNQDRLDLGQKLTQQISSTTDQDLKAALSRLREAIEHRRPQRQDEQASKRRS